MLEFAKELRKLFSKYGVIYKNHDFDKLAEEILSISDSEVIHSDWDKVFDDFNEVIKGGSDEIQSRY